MESKKGRTKKMKQIIRNNGEEFYMKRRDKRMLKGKTKAELEWIDKNKIAMLDASSKIASSIKEQKEKIEQNKTNRYISILKKLDGKPVYNPLVRDENGMPGATETFKFAQ